MATPIRYRTMSGYPLEFNSYLKTGAWRDVPGIYCFAHFSEGTWRISYVGQAGSFRDRMNGHEKWDNALQLGATHVLATVVMRQSDRDRIEVELIAELQPPLNTQLR